MTFKQYILSTYRAGDVFGFKDIKPEYRTPSSIVQLTRLVKGGILGKIAKGVYYRPTKGVLFDSLAPEPNTILNYYCKAKKGYLSGQKIYNALHLTDQVANINEIYCKEVSSSAKISGVNIVFKKAYTSPRGKDIYLLQLLDAITEMNSIGGESSDGIKSKLTSLIKKLSIEKCEQIKQYAIDYPESTQSFLASLH